ncbi:MAG: HAD family hydrolase [Candidatus Bathyarchaeota archaeon]|jgi:putative hydrolase of the HAD superfamily
MRIKAVLFDLGWTLVNIMESPEIYKRILEASGVRISAEEALKAHQANERESNIFEGMIELGEDFWVKWNQKFLERLGIQENRELLAQRIIELWWEYAGLELYPDVVETLTQLKARGVKVGVVTNGLKSDFQQILSKVGLSDHFEVVVGIDTCKKAKPNREIFLYAINKLRVRPGEAIFVGDSVKQDYEGAEKAGLKPLLIDREGKTPANVETIRSLTEVLSYIQKPRESCLT